jgi:ferredoxin
VVYLYDISHSIINFFSDKMVAKETLNSGKLGRGKKIMKKPVIDYDECIGCGSCVELCPEVFELNEDEAKAYVKAEDTCDTCDCEEAIGICPTEAISWSEE